MLDFTTKITKEEFEVEAFKGKVLLDLYKDDCGPCKALAPMLEGLGEFGIKVVKVNGENNPTIASHFGIMGYPALFLLEDGVVVGEARGGNNAMGYVNRLKN
jgi:thioredoxin 1